MHACMWRQGIYESVRPVVRNPKAWKDNPGVWVSDEPHRVKPGGDTGPSRASDVGLGRVRRIRLEARK
jgi:hypothetical protein